MLLHLCFVTRDYCKFPCRDGKSYRHSEEIDWSAGKLGQAFRESETSSVSNYLMLTGVIKI